MKYLDPKYKQKYSPRSESEKVHAKSIESSVIDAVSKEKLASGDAGLGKGKRKT